MALCFSATHLPCVSWTSSAKFRRSCSNLSYVNRSKIFLVINWWNRTYCSKPWKASSSASSSVQLTGVDTEEKGFATLRELCEGHVPEHVINRMEEIGYIVPTDVQRGSLPVLFSGQDCVLHAQTGSGKTLAYLLQVFSEVNPQKFGVQALIVLPTRELGMQVTEVARRLAAKPLEPEPKQKSCTVMALLDGGTLNRHKKWLKAEPPTIIVATLGSLCHMLEKQLFRLETMRVLVIDEVDFMFNSSRQVDSLRRLLTSFSSSSNRQTIFASASVPQPKRFLYDCVQHKWTKRDVVHVHVNAVKPMPSCLHHRFVVCGKRERHTTLLSLLHSDAPKSAIVFVGEQSEKSKKAGNSPPLNLLVDFLKVSYMGCSKLIVLEEDINFNQRAATLLDVRGGGDYLLVATDIAARGVDLPETTHIYNFNLPRDAVNYLHRAGRTDEEQNLLQQIISYRASLNLTALKENDNAKCLAEGMANEFKDQPCTNSTGANTVPGTESQFSSYPEVLQACHLNITTTRDGAIMPACVPNLVPSVVLSNFTESQYSSNLNDTKFTGIGIGSKNDWIVVVLTTDTPEGSFATATNDNSSANLVSTLDLLLYTLFLCVSFWMLM